MKRQFIVMAIVAAMMMGRMAVWAEEPAQEAQNVASTPTATVVFDDWTLTSGQTDDTLTFSGLDAKTSYTLELEFLAYVVEYAESKCTIGRVVAGSEELARDVVVKTTIGNSPMPPAQRWTIPAAAIRDGNVTVRMEKMEALQPVRKAVSKAAGAQQPPSAPVKPKPKVVPPAPFAVHVRVVAGDAKARPIAAALPKKIEIPVVRLTPRPVQLPGVEQLKVDLDGSWQASLKPPADFRKLTAISGENWKPVQVPGELAMQGLEIKGEETAAYWREFDVPADWQGERIKLRCDAIYNDAQIWINGIEAGRHIGNFTAFDLDITEAVKPGRKNVMAVAVRTDPLADSIPGVSWFIARHPAGIVRKIYLFPTPAVNISDVHILTDFDAAYKNGVLTAKVEVRNQSDQPARRLQLKLGLRQRGQGNEAVEPVTASVPELSAGRSVVQEVRLNVSNPKKWDVEHPHLYDLSVVLIADGKEAERVSERIGFRKIEIRGSQVFINNWPVRYHGVVWHETDPLRGRVLSGDDWRRDMKLLRGMNCNYIRFQCVGGPPSEELVEACDEVGIFLEDELPYSWTEDPLSGKKIGVEVLPVTLQSAVEMVMRDRSRASVVQWSLGNEMQVDQNLLIAHRLAMRPLDATRPYLTDGDTWGPLGNNRMDIRNTHYTPASRLVRDFKDSPVPVMNGEWGHVMSYNRREVYTDPGVRDNWAYGIADKWEKMVGVKAYLGGSIWTGVDEYFLMPDNTVIGWGEYGFVDIWRRVKPEYWHFKKIFTPVYIDTAALPQPEAGQPLRIPVENRYAFSDLDEIRFAWELSERNGNASAHVAPGAKGVLEIPLSPDRRAGRLELKAFNAEGLMVDAWRIAVGQTHKEPVAAGEKRKVVWARNADRYQIKCGTSEWSIDANSGLLASMSHGGKTVAVNGPVLLVLPLSGERFNLLTAGRRPDFPFPDNLIAGIRLEAWIQSPTPLTAPCTGWKAQTVEAQADGEAVAVTVRGAYEEADGQFILRFTPDGELNVAYDFKLNERLMAAKKRPCGIVAGKLRPRQLGIVFDLPKTCDTLSWRRQAQWSYYPEDHIGRAEGTAKAFTGIPLCVGAPFYRSKPDWSWSLDTTPQGSADFRSTKANIYEASLTDATGLGLRVVSDGSQHVRAWADGNIHRLLVADVNCEGCLEYYFENRILPSPRFKPGDHVKGNVKLNIAMGLAGKSGSPNFGKSISEKEHTNE